MLADLMSSKATRNALVAMLNSPSLKGDDESDVSLNDVDVDVLRMVDEVGSISVDELTERAKQSSHRALLHRQHAWAALNRLAKRGLLGKAQGARGTVRFLRPHEAILVSLKVLGKFPEECGTDDYGVIAKRTGLNVMRIATEIDEWDQVNDF